MLCKSVSQCRILYKLGCGGMRVAYKAEDTKLKRTVALKFLVGAQGLAPLHDGVALERFRREVRAVSALDHSNICTIHDISEHEGQPFIAAELLGGGTLKHVITASRSKWIDGGGL